MSTEQVTQDTKAEGTNFADLLKQFEGAPSKEQIDAWKAQYGDVYCSAFSEVELFIWRPVTRKEWREHQIGLSQSQTGVDPFQSEETLVAQSMLWASEPGKKALVTKAGSLATLHEQLLQNSNFVEPRLASNLVVKL